jgi:putative ABC transport system permease protein
MPQQAPSWTAVAICGVFVVIAVTLAHRERLGVTREITTAAVRAAVQLAAVGAVLLVLFRTAGFPGAAAWVAGMIALAGQISGRRGRRVPHAVRSATAGVATGAVSTLGILLGTGAVPTVPQVVVPLGGMIVAGSMQASTLVLRQISQAVEQARPDIEARLSLGLAAPHAFAAHRRSALRTALIPVIDSTKVVGLISLPGAMTGLILAGVDPLTAIRYQIIVMFMLLSAATVTATTTGGLAQRALFDPDAHRLRTTG